MHIILIGNICTGKTTLANSLSKKNKFPLFLIDDYRFRFNPDSTFEGEFNAWTNLKKDISNQENSIFESSGTSMWFNVIISRLKGKKIIIKLDSSRSNISERIKSRVQVPLPYDTSDINKSLNHIDSKLKQIEYDFMFDTSKVSVGEIINILNS